jgi:spermidine synthase
MPRDTKIKSFNLDGRQFVQELSKPKHYHLVVQDAVNDLSVPSHIMTQEYNEAVKNILTDDGVYLLTVIDEFAATKGAPQGKLLPAAIRTMQKSFPHVYLLGYQYHDLPLWGQDGRRVWVIAGMSQKLDKDRFDNVVQQQGVKKTKTMVMPDDQLADYLEPIEPIILTDDFVPTDNLIAEAFWRR